MSSHLQHGGRAHRGRAQHSVRCGDPAHHVRLMPCSLVAAAACHGTSAALPRRALQRQSATLRGPGFDPLPLCRSLIHDDLPSMVGACALCSCCIWRQLLHEQALTATVWGAVMHTLQTLLDCQGLRQADALQDNDDFRRGKPTNHKVQHLSCY